MRLTRLGAALLTTTLLIFLNPLQARSQEVPATSDTSRIVPTALDVQVPKVVLAGVPFQITVTAKGKNGQPLESFAGTVQMSGLLRETESGRVLLTELSGFTGGKLVVREVVVEKTGRHPVTLRAGEVEAEVEVRAIPGILSLLPPILAIALALVARQVLISLLAGVWLGAVFIYDYQPLVAYMRTFDTYLIGSLADPDNAKIILFSMTLGGMVGVMSRCGGMQGIVKALSRFASNPRGGQVATWLMGLLIFFDDYANTLIVGNTMRPVADRLRISREKLSYIVDSTAAPVASIALVSTWIGFQVGLIDQAFNTLNIPHDAYIIFLRSIPYATYSILAIFFVLMIAVSLRDFGPMYRAEHRASVSGKVLSDGAQPLMESAAPEMTADPNIPLRWYNGLIPIGVVILVTVVGLYYSGYQSLGEAAATARLGEIFGAANSFDVLMWASFTGLFVAGLLAMGQRLLSLGDTISAALAGYKSMILAAMILILAWSIGKICEDLRTADYVISITKNLISPHLLPFLTFLIAAVISFATGTSWATMAILTPIVVPMAYHLPLEAGYSTQLSQEILIGTVGAVLSGSVFGDHCSPISDTTIMSSLASAADHIDHVRTQIPYAVLVAVVASLSGYLLVGFGLPVIWTLLAGVVALLVILRLVGKHSDYVSLGVELPETEVEQKMEER
jgi:Na+/H+ antiporter NhaC